MMYQICQKVFPFQYLVLCRIHMYVLESSVYLYSFHSNLGHGITTMLLIRPQFSPITAIELCSGFKNQQWPHGEVTEQFPSCPAAQFRRTTASLMYLGGLIQWFPNV